MAAAPKNPLRTRSVSISDENRAILSPTKRNRSMTVNGRRPTALRPIDAPSASVLYDKRLILKLKAHQGVIQKNKKETTIFTPLLDTDELRTTIAPNDWFAKGSSTGVIETENKEEQRKIYRWKRVLTRYEQSVRTNEVANRVYRGLPHKLRGDVWYVMAGVTAKVIKNNGVYTEYVNLAKASTDYDDQIDADINRTWRGHVMFSQRYGFGQIALYNVLKAYSYCDATIGYCQGMSDIAGLILMYLDEEDAFWLLKQVCHDPRFGMRELFGNELAAVRVCYFVHSEIIKDKLPMLHRHMRDQRVVASVYTTEWYMRVFLKVVNVNLAIRIWDVMLYEGYDILFTIALCILKQLKTRILSMTFYGIMSLLTNQLKQDGIINIDALMRDVRASKLDANYLKSLKSRFLVKKNSCSGLMNPLVS